MIEAERRGDVFVEKARHAAGTTVTVGVGPVDITFDPAEMLDWGPRSAARGCNAFVTGR